MQKQKPEPRLQKRYLLKDAASLLGINLTHLFELVGDHIVVPLVYTGHIEVDDGEWIDGYWVPVVNAATEFRKVLDNHAGSVEARFRHHVVEQAKLDHWEVRSVSISELMINQEEIAKAKPYLIFSKSDDGVDVFYHNSDFSHVVYRGRHYYFSALEAHIIKKLIQNFILGACFIKNDLLIKGLVFDGYDNQAKKVFTKNHKEYVFSDNGGFIDRSKNAYLGLTLPKNLKFMIQD